MGIFNIICCLVIFAGDIYLTKIFFPEYIWCTVFFIPILLISITSIRLLHIHSFHVNDERIKVVKRSIRDACRNKKELYNNFCFVDFFQDEGVSIRVIGLHVVLGSGLHPDLIPEEILRAALASGIGRASTFSDVLAMLIGINLTVAIIALIVGLFGITVAVVLAFIIIAVLCAGLLFSRNSGMVGFGLIYLIARLSYTVVKNLGRLVIGLIRAVTCAISRMSTISGDRFAARLEFDKDTVSYLELLSEDMRAYARDHEGERPDIGLFAVETNVNERLVRARASIRNRN